MQKIVPAPCGSDARANPEIELSWWPAELSDCDWRKQGRWGPFQVRPKGSGKDAWRDAPLDPLDQEPMTS